MQRFDIVVIGSGIGGLVCADLLTREGYKVCVIEKNKQLGGCLQSYARNKKIFDSGVHYLGGLAKGQNLYQLFSYLGLMEKLTFTRLDEDCFDRIIIGDESKEYSLAQGYDNFIKTLLKDFPEEEQGIRKYCDEIQSICKKFPLYNLRAGGNFEEKTSVMETDTEAFINSCTQNITLREVLGGNNMLYAGQGDKTPLHVHALIQNHYIESSWKCYRGGSQIGKYLGANIRNGGGTIIKNMAVVRIIGENGLVECVELGDGSRIYGERFVSNIHPIQTLEMVENLSVKPAYLNRINSLENTVSSFTLNIVLKKNCFRYFNYNCYYHQKGRLWTQMEYSDSEWPLSYGMFTTKNPENPEYAESASVITYMHFDEVKSWADTHNTTNYPTDRGASYNEFKEKKAQLLLSKVYERFPELENCIGEYYVATPLSYRDYIGNGDGSLYGVAKDFREPFKTIIPTKTRIRNLFFTGQNLSMHGILGASLSGLITTIAITGNESIVEKIRNA